MAYQALIFVNEKYGASRIVTPAEKTLLYEIANLTDIDKGAGQEHAWPSMRTLSERTGIALSHIEDSLTRLEFLGIIRIVNRLSNGKAKRSNQYFLKGLSEWLAVFKRKQTQKGEGVPLRGTRVPLTGTHEIHVNRDS
jgi:hypothetical protein